MQSQTMSTEHTSVLHLFYLWKEGQAVSSRTEPLHGSKQGFLCSIFENKLQFSARTMISLTKHTSYLSIITQMMTLSVICLNISLLILSVYIFLCLGEIKSSCLFWNNFYYSTGKYDDIVFLNL